MILYLATLSLRKISKSVLVLEPNLSIMSNAQNAMDFSTRLAYKHLTIFPSLPICMMDLVQPAWHGE